MLQKCQFKSILYKWGLDHQLRCQYQYKNHKNLDKMNLIPLDMWMTPDGPFRCQEALHQYFDGSYLKNIYLFMFYTYVLISESHNMQLCDIEII